MIIRLGKLIFVLFLLSSVCFYSQTPPYYHYTSSDGLASSTVFDVLQDKDGLMWFGTLNGLSRFDGKHFTTFNITNGLNSNVITSLLEGKKGELYIGNYEKGVNVLKNGRFENFRSKINGRSFNTTYLIESENNVYAYSSYGIISVASEYSDSLDYYLSTSPSTLNRLVKTSDNSLIALTSTGLYDLKGKKLYKRKIKGLPDSNIFFFYEANEGIYFLGGKGILYQVKNDRVVKKYVLNEHKNKKFYEIFGDSKNNIWFSVLGKGFYIIPSGSDEIINLGRKMGLDNTMIDRIFEDREGNIWICTYGKGIYCLNNLYLRNYTENDGLINNNIICLEKEKSGKLLIGTINGISILEKGVIDKLRDNTGKILSGYINSIKSFGDYVYICWAAETPEVKELTYKGIKGRFLLSTSFFKTNNNLYVFGGIGNNLRILNDYKTDLNGTNMFSIIGDSSYQNRTNVIYADTKNNIWIGTSEGLCKLSDVSSAYPPLILKKTYYSEDPVLGSKINSIYKDNGNTIWFTGVKGLACINLQNDSVKSYTSLFNHNLLTPTSVVSDDKNRHWIGTMKGLYLLEDNSVKILNSQTGLPSDDVLSLYYDKEKNLLYIGTSNGLSVMDVNLFDNYKHPAANVNITRIEAGGSVFTNYNDLVFKPNQNNVLINFRVINYSSPSSITYKYVLNGESRETKNDFLDFGSLDHGTYNLIIMAKVQNSEWGKPLILKFQVLPRFVETIWFSLIVIASIVIIALLVFFWRLKINKNRNKEQLELGDRINELKHQALSAMMNPHFIFNSLNSVQYLINCQRNEEANDYIATMAKLIRKNLDTAGDGFILLSEEINRLKLYLDLEKLRFQDSFVYEIEIGANIEADYLMIPNMIIQPFVENTLWHGIINSGSNGKVSISFVFENVDVDSVVTKSLIIKITDNGIGIKEAKKNKKDDHISKGIQIIEERLKLLSAKMEIPKPIMFEDLSNQNPDSHGTEVIISLPPQLYKLMN